MSHTTKDVDSMGNMLDQKLKGKMNSLNTEFTFATPDDYYIEARYDEKKYKGEEVKNSDIIYN